MPRNGSGTYAAPSNSWNPPVNSTEINPVDWQELLDDLEDAHSSSIAKDGQTTTTAAIPLALGALINSGSAAAPSLAFIGDTNTGFYRIAADTIGATVGGTEALRLSAALAKLSLPQLLIGDAASLTVNGSANGLDWEGIHKWPGTFDEPVRHGATRVWRGSNGNPRWLSSAAPGSAGAGEDFATIAKAFTANGYWKTASGLIFQWGAGTSGGDGNATVTFPLAFPSACLFAIATRSSTNGQIAQRTSVSTTQLGVRVYATATGTDIPSVSFSWFAFGV